MNNNRFQNKLFSGWLSRVTKKNLFLVCYTCLIPILASHAFATHSYPPPSPVGPQTSSTLTTQSLELLTTDLLNLNARKNTLSMSEKAALIEMAKVRKEAILTEVKVNPGAVYRVLLSNTVRSTILEAAQLHIEKEEESIVGTFLAVSSLNEAGAETSRIFLVTNDNQHKPLYILNYTTSLPRTGTKVKLSHFHSIPNAPFADVLITGDSKNIEEIESPALITPERTIGMFKALAILVNFQDQPTNKPWDADSVKRTLFTDLNNYFFENSFQKTSLVGDVAGWFTIPVNSTESCDGQTNSILQYAQAAAKAAGFNDANYDRTIVVFPRMGNCIWSGLAYIGTISGHGYSWINGSPSLLVLGHELGHNFGLWHGNAYDCGSDSSIGSNCTNREYNDPVDIMGNRAAAHFSAFHKEALGWLNSNGNPPIETITQNKTLTLEPYETKSVNPKAFKILKANLPNGSQDYYYLEFRQPIGFDAVLSNFNGNLTNGVVIHQGNSLEINSSHLLDMTPSTTNNFFDSALVSGATFTDPHTPQGGVSITVNSVTPAGASVTIKFGNLPPPCVKSNPTVTISPSATQWILAGAEASYAVALQNNDGANCPHSSFALATSAQSSLTANLGTSTFTLSPGSTASTQMRVHSSVLTATGLYAIHVKGTSNEGSQFSNTASVSLGVQAPPQCIRANPVVTLSPQTQSTWIGGMASYQFSVLNKDSTGCNGSSFIIDGDVPQGLRGSLSTTSLFLSPGAMGSVTITTYTSNLTKEGTYTFFASATNSGATSSTAKTSATLTVNRPLQVSVSSNQEVYSRTPTSFNMLFTVRALYTNVAAVGAPLTVVLTLPNGMTSTATSTIGPDGTRGFFVRINMNSLPGTYTFEAKVTMNGVTSIQKKTVTLR